MSTIDVAVVREQGVTFAVLSVADSIIGDRSRADDVIARGQFQFGCPTVLIGARQHRLYGRQDIVRFLGRVHPGQLPWRRMTVS